MGHREARLVIIPTPSGWKWTAAIARRRTRRLMIAACAVIALFSGLVVRGIAASAPVGAATSAVDGATRGADNLRTGWYPDQTNLTPALVSGGTFGQLFDTAVNGAVYGQPLVDDGQMLVNTENNYAYGLDPVTGAILWTRQFGSPVLASEIGCADLTPTMGITSTPVVDQATDTEYLVDNQYVSGDSGPRLLHARPQPGRQRCRGARFPGGDRGHRIQRPLADLQPVARAPASRAPAHERRGVRRLRRPLRHRAVAGLDRRRVRDGHPADHVDQVATRPDRPERGGASGCPAAAWSPTAPARSCSPPATARPTGPDPFPATRRRPTWASRWSAWPSSRTVASRRSTSSPPTTPPPWTTTTSTSARAARWRCPTRTSAPTAIPAPGRGGRQGGLRLPAQPRQPRRGGRGAQRHRRRGRPLRAQRRGLVEPGGVARRRRMGLHPDRLGLGERRRLRGGARRLPVRPERLGQADPQPGGQSRTPSGSAPARRWSPPTARPRARR